MPDCNNIVFSSLKRGRYAQEECLIELFFKEKRITTYVLDKTTRVFKEKNKEKQESTLDTSISIEESER